MPKCSTEVKILNFTDIIAYINHLRFSTFSVTSENALNFGDCRYFMLWLLNILQTATFSFGLSLQMRLQLFWYDFLHISLFLSILKRNFWFFSSSLTERSLSFRSHSELFFHFHVVITKRLSVQTSHTLFLGENQMVETCLSWENIIMFGFNIFFLFGRLCCALDKLLWFCIKQPQPAVWNVSKT